MKKKTKPFFFQQKFKKKLNPTERENKTFFFDEKCEKLNIL